MAGTDTRTAQETSLDKAFERMAESVLRVQEAVFQEALKIEDKIKVAVGIHFEEYRIQEAAKETERESQRRRADEAMLALEKRMEQKTSERIEEHLGQAREHKEALKERLEGLDRRTRELEDVRSSTEKRDRDRSAEYEALEGRIGELELYVTSVSERFDVLEKSDLLVKKEDTSDAKNDASLSTSDHKSSTENSHQEEDAPEYPAKPPPSSPVRPIRRFLSTRNLPLVASEALMRAADSGQVEFVRSVLDENADPNYCNSEGETALHRASMHGHADVAVVLLEHDADVHAETHFGTTALHFAASYDCEGRCLDVLLRGGARVLAEDREGKTPLHWAAFNDNPEAARALIQAGAPLDARDHEGKTPLHWAAYNANEVMVALLVEAGASKTVRDESGKRPYDIAQNVILPQMLLP